MKKLSRSSSVFIALLVTFMWSTSFIIIKLGLLEIPPITFAGLRYTMAFMCLLPFALRKERIEEIKKIEKRDWHKLILLGFTFYTFTQGTLFLGLSLLPSVTVSLILNFTPVLVAIMGVFLLSEKPSSKQWFGALLFIAGVVVYFFPADLAANKITGLIVMLVGVIANASSSILGRSVNRGAKFHPLTVTIISMGAGSAALLIVGIAAQGFPAISLKNILFLVWLSGINTALAFTLWNLSLRSLTAMESSIINGTMLIQIAFLAWIFLGETITLKEVIGMLIAASGALLVQLKKAVRDK
ncbi:MAG: DMT family transporter [Bacteroidota bacterium]